MLGPPRWFGVTKTDGKEVYLDLFSLEGVRFLVCGHTSRARLCNTQESGSSCHIEGGLSEHGVDGIFHNGRESSSLGSVVEMTQPEVLLNDVSLF